MINPWFGFGPALVLIAAWVLLRGWRDPKPLLRAWPLAAGAIWGLYGVWEWQVVGESDNVRADLILLGPFLIASLVLAVVALATGPQRIAAAQS